MRLALSLLTLAVLAAPAAADAKPLLVGGCAPEVERLQSSLEERGFSAGGVDGCFGARTRSAVQAFQKAAGVRPDGIVGPLTLGGVAPNRPAAAARPRRRAPRRGGGARRVPAPAADVLPDGYVRAETAAAVETDPTAMGHNPVSRGVVSTAYRRGISRFIVATRLVGPNLSVWSDPLFASENVAAAERPVTFTGGAL